MAKKKGKLKPTISSGVTKQPAPEGGKDEVIAVSPNPIPAAKVCRLCESIEGPFLNIFDGNTSKKIDELMPFTVAENDELPHKICFRCSAKIEDLHEFVGKCTKTQESLFNSLGKKYPTSKVKTHRSIWEEKLNQSNKTNDDICDAVIKKAMEGIKDIPVILLVDEVKSPYSKIDKHAAKAPKAPTSDTVVKVAAKMIETELKNKNENISKDIEIATATPKTTLKLCLEKCDAKPATRSSRSNNDSSLLKGVLIKPKKAGKAFQKSSININSAVDTSVDTEQPNGPVKDPTVSPNIRQDPPENKDVTKPFNIMDHVSMIKVNGVGVLFQCKLCNRNFLKKDVVLSHWCAKNGVAKEDIIKRAAPPEPRRVTPTVKYINTKSDELKKQQGLDSKSDISKTNIDSKNEGVSAMKINNAETKPKPKIGPASKVKRTCNDLDQSLDAPSTPILTIKGKSGNVVQCPAVPSLNCRYKLVPGPNNTFTLVEAQQAEVKLETVDLSNDLLPEKRKSSVDTIQPVECIPKQRKVLRSENAFRDSAVTTQKSSPEDVMKLKGQLQERATNQPYPVGLFQTVSRHSKSAESPTIIPFATTLQKKQSYTIVQTGNPNKLLISAKPQPVQEEGPKIKRERKIKAVPEAAQQQPFSVTLEDATHSDKDSGFFTFINVDPLLQPSYVLPTDNILQESQISTSSLLSQKAQNPGKGEQYTCNMCNAKFTREQKLLVHIQSHYSKMDEEDQMRDDKPSRKRGKKSQA